MQFGQEPIFWIVLGCKDKKLMVPADESAVVIDIRCDREEGPHEIGWLKVLEHSRMRELHRRCSVPQVIKPGKQARTFVMIHFKEGQLAGIDQRKVGPDERQGCFTRGAGTLASPDQVVTHKYEQHQDRHGVSHTTAQEKAISQENG